MAIKKCKDCGKEVSSSARACPHCGKMYPAGGLTRGAKIFLFLIAVPLIIGKIAEGTSRSQTLGIGVPEVAVLLIVIVIFYFFKR
jgi:hypothetical protein